MKKHTAPTKMKCLEAAHGGQCEKDALEYAGLRAIEKAAREYLDLVIDRKGTVGDQIRIVAALRAALDGKEGQS